MRKFSFLFFIAAMSLTACKQDFKKGDKGLEYKIISEGSGAKVKMGDYMQMHICQLINNGKADSLLNDTRTTSGPIIEQIDSVSVPPEYYKILSQMKKGDSLIMRLLTDSMFAQSPGAMPPFFKKGGYFITTVKLINVFTTQAEMDSARSAEMVIKERKEAIENKISIAKEDKTLQTLFKKDNITTVKSELGTYVQIIKPGVGPNIDTSVVVKTNYTGRTLKGKMFDSNTDPAKGHVEPFTVNMTNDETLGQSVIKGWTDGFKMLNKGAIAKFYIPSALAYGKRSAGEDIGPNSILVFDIEVLDVLTKDQARAEMESKVKIRKMNQQKFYDSIAKIHPDTTTTKVKH